jgi:hypothetical protein
MGRLFLDSYYSYKKYFHYLTLNLNGMFLWGEIYCAASVTESLKKSSKFMIAYVIFPSIVKLTYAESPYRGIDLH